MRGKSSSGPEVTKIEAAGVTIRVDGKTLFLDFDNFPWFRDAAASDIRHVEAPHPEHLRWPRLDVDLTIESIEHPERYPLKAK